jgi:hypothetical protein
VFNLRLQSIVPEELDVQTAVELLAKKAARNAAKAAKAAGSSSSDAEPGAVSPTVAAQPKAAKAEASKPPAAKAVVSKSKAAKGSSKSAGSGSNSGSSAGGKPGRRKKSNEKSAGSAPRKASAAAAGGNGDRSPAAGGTASSADAAAPSGAGSGGGGAGSRKPSAWMAFRKARWEGVKAQHGGIAGREVSIQPVFGGLMSEGHCFVAPLIITCCATLRWCSSSGNRDTQLLLLALVQLFAAVNKALGEEWRALSAEEQARFSS